MPRGLVIDLRQGDAEDRAPRNRAQFTSLSQEWNTPLEVLELVRAFDRIGLDPCSNAGSIVGAATEWRLDRDGDSLSRDWRGRGLVYVNPPYSRHLLRWAAKCAHSGAEVLALVPSRTDARWWQDHAATAGAICYWRGRLRFHGALSSAPFPSAVLYWGPRVDRFCETFSHVGIVTRATQIAPAVDKALRLVTDDLSRDVTATMRRCASCGAPLDAKARADARFHRRCRQKAYRQRLRATETRSPCETVTGALTDGKRA